MRQAQHRLTIETQARLHRHHARVAGWLASIVAADGLVTLFIRHTSASLTIQENADPDVLRDLLDALQGFAPRDAGYAMTSRARTTCRRTSPRCSTSTSLSVPVSAGRMLLGTWQAVYLIEHRDRPHTREVVLHYVGE